MVVCLLSVQRYKFNYNIFLIILYFKMLVTAVQHLWVFVHYLCTGRLIKSDSLYKLLVLFSVIEMVNHFKVPIMMDFSIIDSYSMFQSLVSFQYFFCQLVSLAWMIPSWFFHLHTVWYIGFACDKVIWSLQGLSSVFLALVTNFSLNKVKSRRKILVFYKDV